MKKIASVIFILIITITYVYNALGYGVLTSLKDEQSWINTMQKKSISEYNVLKLNASLYSFIEDSELENVDGDVSINNKVYHIFKKKIKDNVIYIYYLPNTHVTVDNLHLKKIVDLFNSSEHPDNKKPYEKFSKTVIKDYFPVKSFQFTKNSKFNFYKLNNSNNAIGIIHSGYLSLIFSPPEFI